MSLKIPSRRVCRANSSFVSSQRMPSPTAAPLGVGKEWEGPFGRDIMDFSSRTEPCWVSEG